MVEVHNAETAAKRLLEATAEAEREYNVCITSLNPFTGEWVGVS